MPLSALPNRRASFPSHHVERPDYDQAADDFMRDLEFDDNISNARQEPPKNIDEEVQVKKKRKPNPKLDETRLLSHNGVPKLRNLAKTRLRFRGKGHEYADISTLLNMYQLWLDDLYPKAKFKDGLTMVEKVGHSKRMQVTRRAWLDSTKPHARQTSPERFEDVHASGGTGSAEGDGEAIRGRERSNGEDFDDASQQEHGWREPEGDRHEDAPKDDELDALLNENNESDAAPAPTSQPKTGGPFEEESDPEEDELDGLLAEQETLGLSKILAIEGGAKPKSAFNNDVDDFADDEEAMASMEW